MATASDNKPTMNIDGKELDLSWKMFSNIPSVIHYHFKEGNMNWPYIVFFTIVHATAFLGLCRLQHCSNETSFQFVKMSREDVDPKTLRPSSREK